MRNIKLAAVAAVSVWAAACGQGETQNVMAPRATPLSNAQVEQALGPEPDNAVAQRAVEGEEAVIGGNGMQGEQQ